MGHRAQNAFAHQSSGHLYRARSSGKKRRTALRTVRKSRRQFFIQRRARKRTRHFYERRRFPFAEFRKNFRIRPHRHIRDKNRNHGTLAHRHVPYAARSLYEQNRFCKNTLRRFYNRFRPRNFNVKDNVDRRPLRTRMRSV